jgi:NMD protein affecting ribosome stability and mRNA decay
MSALDDLFDRYEEAELGDDVTCNRCGRCGLHWEQRFIDKRWHLYTETDRLHVCADRSVADEFDAL